MVIHPQQKKKKKKFKHTSSAGWYSRKALCYVTLLLFCGSLPNSGKVSFSGGVEGGQGHADKDGDKHFPN